MTTVWCTAQFEGFHAWIDAPEQYAYLRLAHRHIFHVRLELIVGHSNREVEFIDLKQKLQKYCESSFGALGIFDSTHPSSFSCETMARRIASEYEDAGYAVHSVTVSEDGENGATYRANNS